MLSVVCNRDLPETMFDVKDDVIIHVAESLEAAVRHSTVDVMVIVDDGWRTRRFLKSIEFEVLVDHNPNISFVVCTNRSRVFNFVNDMTADYRNLDIVEVREMPYVTITDRPRSTISKQGLLEQFNDWFENLLNPQKKAGVA